MKHHALRAGAVLALLSILILALADLSHGGHDPADLPAVLPEYAANPNWKVVHLAQFAGGLMAIGAMVFLLDYLKAESGTPFATLGLLTAVVTASAYAINQAVDGVAIQYVAEMYVNAASPDKASALQLAETVRHIEQGLSSLAAINLAVTLLLTGLAISFTRVFPRWLGWLITVAGGFYLVSGLFLNYRGFSEHVFTFWVNNLLLICLLVMAAILWRESNRLARLL